MFTAHARSLHYISMVSHFVLSFFSVLIQLCIDWLDPNSSVTIINLTIQTAKQTVLYITLDEDK